MNVLRRFLVLSSLLLAITLAITATDDFWTKKEWKAWTRDECEKILSESPWAKTWRSPGNGTPEVFTVQLRSALPIREALVREQQLDQKYDTMDEDKRKLFDSQAEKILSRTYDDMILVHVDFSKTDSDPSLMVSIQIMVNDFTDSATGLNARLVTETRDMIKPLRVESKNKPDYQFNLVFPRMKDGGPVVKEGVKFFEVQFQSPSPPPPQGFGPRNIPNYLVIAKFEISKMLVNGKPSF